MATAVKKDTENCAPGIFFGPSYFVTTLGMHCFSINKKTVKKIQRGVLNSIPRGKRIWKPARGARGTGSPWHP
jgi:hypothetical protein